MGFTKTLGTDLIISVIKSVNPTTLIQIQSDKNHLNFPYFLNKEFVMEQTNIELDYDLKILKSLSGSTVGKPDIEPKVLRDMNIFSYFSQMLVTGDEEISSIAPYS